MSTLLGRTGGSVTLVLTSPTITGPEGIAVDNSGNLFFSNINAYKIYEYIP